MLIEIFCEKFRNKKITFNSGLNVVLGSNTGDNSIGKTTLLLIIDYIFGGTTYSSMIDIKKHVGNHNIYFKFIFNDKQYYFCRSFEEGNEVWQCNINYDKIKKITLKEYMCFLAKQYHVDNLDLSFRDAVSIYSRIYGKDNYNEHKPLQFKNENYNSSLLRLIKLFNLYLEIKQEEINYNDKKEISSIYKKSQEKQLIPKINNNDYKKNIIDLKKLNEQLKKLEIEANNKLADLDTITAENVINIKKELTSIKRQRTSIMMKIEPLDENLNYKFSICAKEVHELQKYFPNINVKKIEEVESFHNKISAIFSKEIKEEKEKLESLLEEYDRIIDEYEKQIIDLIGNKNLSTAILLSHSQLINKIEKKKKENEIYEQMKLAKENEKSARTNLENERNNKLSIVSNSLNNEIKKINFQIMGENNNVPVIKFNNLSYSYNTPNDTGTGTAYKGLVIFDLSILKLTNLPFIIHDSMLFKQISDYSLEKILEIYDSTSKQIFIALDKPESYTLNTNNLLINKKIIELSKKNKLFETSW